MAPRRLEDRDEYNSGFWIAKRRDLIATAPRRLEDRESSSAISSRVLIGESRRLRGASRIATSSRVFSGPKPPRVATAPRRLVDRDLRTIAKRTTGGILIATAPRRLRRSRPVTAAIMQDGFAKAPRRLEDRDGTTLSEMVLRRLRGA